MEEQRNWVRYEGYCTVQTMLLDLVEVVRSDVREMNSLLEKQGKEERYTVIRDPRPSTSFGVCVKDTPAGLSFVVDNQRNAIMIDTPLEYHSLWVYVRWDEKTYSCHYFMDEGEQRRQVQLWEISRKALYPMFFGTEGI